MMDGTSLSLLLDDFTDQDKQFATAFSILRNAISDHAFPSASIAVTHNRKLVLLKAFGRFIYEAAEGAEQKIADVPRVDDSARRDAGPNSQVHSATLFDLGSLTKVVATTSMAMLLYERGLLDLEAPAAGVVPEFLTDAEKDPRRNRVTLRMLLAHSSGLPAHEKLFLRSRTRDEVLQAAFTTPLAADPGSCAVYSDIGFITLGSALERLADEPLDRFCQREVFSPLAMTSTTFNPPAELRSQIPPTVDDRTFRHRIIQGEVYDENASVLGGVAPHAGLFSNARDLAQFAHYLIRGHMIFRRDTIVLFTRRESSPAGTTRTLGWDTPSAPSQSGKYFSTQSFGHLGYTGTSLWIDPTRQLSITLLTNRTWPDCSNQAIKQIRSNFHDAVVESLEEI
jgi:serine-type D-Ala-D-Ala carboxypeptidase